MTPSFRKLEAPTVAMHVVYRDAKGNPVPVIAEQVPLSKESLEFEVRALRLINAAMRERVAELEKQLAAARTGA